MFLFSIGPVKALIENSRKAMDLYAGSRLLSEVTWESVKWLDEKPDVKILVPDISGLCEEFPANIPNRLVAEFEGYTRCGMEKTAEELTSFTKQCFSRKCLDMLNMAGIGKKGTEWAEKQWRDFLEVYWVFEDYEPSDYPQVYQKLRAEIRNVKGIRIFSQTEEPWGRKCMLFPQYNAIFAKRYERNGKRVFPYHINPDYVCDITDNEFLKYAVKGSEALSSIALVKRIYGKTETDIYSLRYMLLKSRVTQKMFIEAGIDARESGQGDMIANAVYDLKNGNLLKADEYSPDVIQQAKNLHGLITKQHVELEDYYAIVKFDGDSMGDAFNALKSSAEQMELSKKISSFANQVPGIILRYGGLPVFAGGEDFLGFLPLDGLFNCISELHELFKDTVQHSFSAGISIAHLMQPLKEVMAYADSMEVSAKKMPDKNAFAISIIKRSGDIVKMPPFKLTGEQTVPQWKHIGELVDNLKNSQCSKSVLYNITNLMKYFLEEDARPENAMAEILLMYCVLKSASEDKQIDKEGLVKTLMRFYVNTDSIGDFLRTIEGIVFLSKEVI